MTNIRRRRWLALGLISASSIVFGPTSARAADDSWTNTAATGLWQDATKWSLLAAPTITHSAVFITNVTTKTVTINSDTPSGNLTISNLTVQGVGTEINTLQLTNAPASTLRILNGALVGTNAVVLVTNSALRVDGLTGFNNYFDIEGVINVLAGGVVTSGVSETTVGNGTLTVNGGSFFAATNIYVGINANTTGTIWVAESAAQLVCTNSFVFIGYSSVGQMTVSNGTWLARAVNVAHGIGSQGTLTIDGGTNRLFNALTIGASANVTGAVWMTGSTAQLVITNANTNVGGNGVGQMAVSNGSWLAANVIVGSSSQGTLTIAGGTNRLSAVLTLGNGPGASGAVWVTGGDTQLVATNSSGGMNIAVFGVGQMAVSNGTWLARDVTVGYTGGSQGTLTIAGGTNRLLSILTVGSDADATGTVWMTSSTAQLVVTNGYANIGRFGVGQMNVSNGTWLVGSVVVGNDGGSQGTLTIAGGTTRLVADGLTISAFGSNSTGTVWLTGSTAILIATNTSVIGQVGTGRLTVSNGTWLANSVIVGNAGGSQGTLTMAGGTNIIDTVLTLGNSPNATGTVVLAGGSLWVTNAAGTAVLELRTGALLLNAGTLSVDKLIVTNGVSSLFTFNGGALSSRSSFFTNGANPVVVGAAGNTATLDFQGTTHSLANGLTLGNSAGSRGVVWMTGTQLVVTNGDTKIGFSGVGQMTMSNGTWRSRRVDVGSSGSSVGTLTIAGGDCFIAGSLFLGFSATATGTVWVTGGQLTNDSTRIGQINFGQMTVSNGIVRTKAVLVAGDNFGSRGLFTVAGGTNLVDTSLTLGNFNCTSTGAVILAGGSLFVTNSAGNALLEVRSGTLTVSAGTLVIDNLVLTNACGRLVKGGGTVSATTTNLDPNLSAVGDSIPNSWKQQYGFDPFDPNVASTDSDNDGCDNLCEYLSGGNPLADIKSIKREGNDIRVTWLAGNAKPSALQRSPGAGGSYSTNNFADIFIVTNNFISITNHLDVGAATNVPAFYYRVRLVP